MKRNPLTRLEKDMGLTCDGVKHNRCTAQAVYIARIHLIDHCNKPKLSINGDKICLLCPNCLQSVAADVEHIVTLISKSKAPICATCSRSVFDIHDMLDIELLMAGAL